MKKLQKKVFFTIFSLLTIFSSSIIFSNLTKNYMERKHRIEDTLRIVSRSDEKTKNRPTPPPTQSKNENIKRVFLDFSVYTIILDEDGKYKELISHTEEEEEEEIIKKEAINIIKTHKTNSFIGNLYKEKYAYLFRDNQLFLMDNTKINKELRENLFTSLILFLLLEFTSGIVSYIISLWIVNPVKKAFQQQKQFIADASHELKTPLSVMSASLEAYQNDKNEKWIENTKKESERMTNLVKELLDSATIEEKKAILKNENLSDIVESSILTYESIFFEKKIKLHYEIEKGIYQLLNADQIKQLMSILIDNSISHCKNEKKVNINLYKKEKQIILEVKNTGDSIKKEEEEKIFERFYKVDTSRNRDNNHYGLGLSIAKSIITIHKGQISASSKNGVTTFKVIWNQK